MPKKKRTKSSPSSTPSPRPSHATYPSLADNYSAAFHHDLEYLLSCTAHFYAATNFALTEFRPPIGFSPADIAEGIGYLKGRISPQARLKLASSSPYRYESALIILYDIVIEHMERWLKDQSNHKHPPTTKNT